MNPELLHTAQLAQAWRRGRIVGLAGPEPREQAALAAALGPGGTAALERQWGPGVVLGSGGSRGGGGAGRRWCLLPLGHLRASAASTGRWLEGLGLDPAACVHLNPLPTHHVSGLLPWLRARQWGARHRRLDPAWMRQPAMLAQAAPLPAGRPVLLSLVPTQLQRLMAEPAGEQWLRRLSVIWVGGAPLPPELASRARAAGLPLAPCYGATETVAMVTALSPARFLDGVASCGPPLSGVELRCSGPEAAVELRCGRLVPGWLEAGQLRPLPRDGEGWWRSGDAGRLGPQGLDLLGRLDGAIHSGGETVFPEQLEQRLTEAAAAADLPLRAVLLLGVDDREWGQRLVALVRAEAGADGAALQARLERICAGWAPAERPRRWLLCPELAPSPLGKWQRGRWQRWLMSLEAGHADVRHRADEHLQR
ncbi:AMP-binding protein [Cyanobium sp. CH-040]|uniref:AMP-binding protein n=1 Tax=Cyanobium sp. CH-040 TaxID=2823708 RepID=UPI0020CE3D25|nr:AMP-binding protein [Cyanobium sp. CH-040]MCP9926709.1 AMP-binding protein [Cyanobium sp. CH-040]